MTTIASTLPHDPLELKRIAHRYEQEIELLREQIRLLYARIFGKKSEKGKADSTSVQLPLFDMPEPEAERKRKRL